MKEIQIVDTFDSTKDYGIHISPQSVKCLSVLKKGEKFIINDFVRSHLNEFTDKVTTEHTNRCLVYKAFRIGRKIGIIKNAETRGITFDECVKLESVEYFLNHYSKSHYKNIISDKHGFRGTQRSYGYALKNFNNWLIGKSLEYEKLIHTGNDNYKKVTESVTLSGLEDLLKLVQESIGNKSHFIKIIKKYLNDSCHEDKSSSSMSSIYFAINGYFEKNEEEQIAKEISDSGANMLFVAITSPKKEIFLNTYKNQLQNVNFIMGVGGSFDVIAGKVKRAPLWMQNFGMEWLYRVIQEPKRMWKRYLIGNTKFILLVVKEFFRAK